MHAAFGTCRCENDPRKFPAAPMRRNITYNSPVRYECGPSPDWYAANYYCTQNIDEDALFPVLGGCRYDYPLGDCLQQPVLAGVSRGCAAEVDVLMSARISGTASNVIGIAFVVSVTRVCVAPAASACSAAVFAAVHTITLTVATAMQGLVTA
jgi:hypothetical protein